MSKHKFEPFDRVLVRDVYGVWKPDFYGYSCPGFTNAHMLASGVKYPEVLPYTTETAHLIGTSDPYEPPKPPHEYKWGDKVEVKVDGAWMPAVFMEDDCSDDIPICVVIKRLWEVIYVERENIRPLEPSHD